MSTVHLQLARLLKSDGFVMWASETTLYSGTKMRIFQDTYKGRSCFTGRVTEGDIIWVETLMSKSLLDVQ